MYRRVIVSLFFFALWGQAQSGSPGGTKQPAPAHRSFFRTRRGLAVLGGVAAGAGAILLATAGRTRQVPAANCSFYPAPFVPCAAAQTVTARNGAQQGFGGGLLVGGAVLVYASLR